MNLTRAILTVGGLTMVSRVLGFTRDILIAAAIGAGPVADAFFFAFKLPNFFRRLFAEGAFNAGFVPLFSETLTKDGHEAAKQFAEQALAWLLFGLLVFITALQVAMPWVVPVLAPGFVGKPETYELAILFARLTFPYLLFISLVSLLGGVLNSVGRFAAMAATPIFLNICLISAVLIGEHVVQKSGHALSWGVAAAGMVQLVWLALSARRHGFGLRLRWPQLAPRLRRLFTLILPAALGAGVVQINLLIDLFLASLLPTGSLSYLFYADRLNQLPIGVVGVAVGTALLPMMSRLLASGDAAGANDRLNRAIEITLLLGIPAMLALIVIPDALMRTLFQRGAFDIAAADASANALMAYAVGLPAYVLIKVLSPAFYAHQDTRTPFIISAAAVGLNVILNVILMQFLLHVGLALATALSSWSAVAALSWILLRRGAWQPDQRLRQRVLRMTGAALAMAALLLALLMVLDAAFAAGASEGRRITGLALLVVLGGAGYALAAVVSGALPFREARQLLRRQSPS